jgi:hypothetical protein
LTEGLAFARNDLLVHAEPRIVQVFQIVPKKNK